MEYVKKDLGSYKLHIIKTKKFKTVLVKSIFRSPIIKEEITLRNILSDVLMQSSKNYDSKRKLTIKAQDLYAAEVGATNARFGNYITTSFQLNILNDKYTEKGNFSEAIKFLGEIIFNPDIENNGFKKENVDIVKTNCRTTLNSLKDDASSYSLIRMLEEFDETSPVSYRLAGYISDLDKINEFNLYEYYQKMLKSDLVDIFVLGDVNEDEVTHLFREVFKLRTVKKERVPYLVLEKEARKRREFNEKIENSQSKLAIACRCSNLTDYERNYVLTLYNVIFGGGFESKLFNEVREKNSLCYSIYSVPNKLDRLLIIQAGIDKSNYEKTVKLILKNMEDMKKGYFSEDDISTAREYFFTALDEVIENPDRIIDNYLMMELINTDTIEVKREMIKKVTKDEIIAVAKKIKLDTIFLLEGVRDEKD